MRNIQRIISVSIAAALACAGLLSVVPSATAASVSGVVTSERSFPRTTAVRKHLLDESTPTEVEDDSNWGGIESLNVPQTKSQAEKDAEAAAKEREAAAQQEAASQAAASRSAERTALPEVPSSKNGSAIAEYAAQFRGYPYRAGGNTPSGWDCSGFVQYVFAQFGISLPRTSGAQAAVGVEVPSLAQAQPGDILADGTHAAIYIGNGMVMNAMSEAYGTNISSTSVFMGRSFHIRRVLN